MTAPGLCLLLVGLAGSAVPTPGGAAAPRVAPGAAPQRIVALAPSAAEILFALGVAPRVVAVSDFAAGLPEAAGKPRVGGFTPDVERILALRPDLAVVSRDGTDRASAERLASLGVPVVVTEGTSLAGVRQDVVRVGEAVGEEAAARRLAARMLQREEAARARALRRPGAPPRVAVVIWPDPPILAGPSSFLGDLLRAANARNCVPDETGEWPRISPETLLAWNPDVVVRPETRENAAAFRTAFASVQPWSRLSAVREGRVVGLPGDWLERPGPRLVDALEALVDRLDRLASATTASGAEPGR